MKQEYKIKEVFDENAKTIQEIMDREDLLQSKKEEFERKLVRFREKYHV